MSFLHVNDRTATYPQSLYADGRANAPLRPPLDADGSCDVAIVGGGYTGLSAALHLAQAGHSVRLLEAHRVGFGASGRNGGQVGIDPRLDQITLERRFGPDIAHALWDMAQAANRMVRDIAAGAPECDWHPGIAYLNRTQAGADSAARYAEHLHAKYGYDAYMPLDRAKTRELVRSPAFVGGILAFDAAQIDPLAMALRLAHIAEAAGAIIHERSEVTAIGPGTRITANGFTLRASHVILAGNGYLQGLNPPVEARVFPINNYIVATEPLPEGAVFSRRLAAADDRFVVNYWRTTADNRLIFGGGESYGDRFPDDIAAKVRGPLGAIFPHLADVSITHAWGGTLAITKTRLPWIGQPGPGLWAAGGYSGHGVAMAMMAGRVLAGATEGDGKDLAPLAATAPGPFPGGAMVRRPLLRLAMSWFALRDRIGL